MKLHQDNNDNANVVTGYGDDHIMVNKLRHDGNLILTADSMHAPWAPQASGDLVALSAADLAAVAALRPEIIIVGTGRRQRFPAPAGSISRAAGENRTGARSSTWWSYQA